MGRDDVMPLRRIERFTSHKIRVHEVEGMESRFRPQDRKPGAGGGRPHGGKRPNGGGGWGGKKSFGDRDHQPREHRGDRSFNDRGGDRQFGDRGGMGANARSEGAAGEHVANRGHFGDRQRHVTKAATTATAVRSCSATAVRLPAVRIARRVRKAKARKAREPRARSPYDERQPSDNPTTTSFPNAGCRDGRSFAGGDCCQGPAGQGWWGHGGKSHGHGGSQERRPREGGFAAGAGRRDRYPSFRD
ncbi:MAG: hypothetical protein U1E47_03980 [Rivihabitans pingtungensis]